MKAENLPFNLQDGEKILLELKPVKELLLFFLASRVLVWIAFYVIFFFFIFNPERASRISGFLGFASWGLALLILMTFVASYLQYKQRRYWITSERIVFKKGLIGYSVSSVPLERISDLIISRSFLEKLLGFGSIYVQSLAGQMSYSYRGMGFGAEASLQGLKNPEEIQELIFSEVKKKRKEQKITF